VLTTILISRPAGLKERTMSPRFQSSKRGAPRVHQSKRFASVWLGVFCLCSAISAQAANVTSTADDGSSGTLRVEIEAANATTGSSTIDVNVGSDQTIQLVTDSLVVPPRPLPIGITQPLVIDASSSTGLTLTRLATSGDSFSLSADTTFKNVANFTHGGIAISSGVNLRLDQTTQAGEVQSSISGSGSLKKEGAGTLTLSGKNSWAGGTTVSGGDLVIATGDSLPTSSTAGIADTTVEKDAQLTFLNDSAASYAYAGSIDGDGKVLKDGTGTVELAGPTAGILSDWKGGTEILNGTLKVTALTSLPQNTPADPTIGDVDISGSSGILELHLKTNGTYAGVASGNGQLKKSGIATLTLGNLNTYTGGTSISEGVLIGQWVGNVSTLGTGGVMVSSETTFDLDTAALDENFDQRIEGEGGVSKSGTGELTLSSDSNSYSGGIAIEGGKLRGTTSSIPGAITFNTDSRVTFEQTFDGTHDAKIVDGKGGGAVHIHSPGFTVSLTSSENDYTRGTFVDAGNLTVSASSLPVHARPAGASCLTVANPLDACVAAGSSLTFSEHSDNDWAGIIGDAGSVAKTGVGALTWTQPQAYTGNTTVSEGTLFLNNTLETARIDVASGATLGGLALLTTAAPTHVAGTITPGDASTLGTLTLGGPVTFDSTSSLRVRVDPNKKHDTLKVAAGQPVTINPGAKLVVEVLPGDYLTTPIVFTALDSTQWNNPFDFTDDYAFLKVDAIQTVGGVINVSVGLDPAADVASFAKTRNERAVGDALINVFATDNPVGNALQAMDTEQVPGALNQLSGVPITSSFTTRVAESQRFSRSVARRVRIYANRETPNRKFEKPPANNPGNLPAWRQEASFFQAPGTSAPGSMGQLHWNGAGSDDSGDDASAGWGGWMDGYGMFGDIDNSINASGYDYKIYGGAGAIDYGFENDFLLGASIGYARTDIDSYDSYSAESNGDTARGALYGAYANPQIGAYATLLLSYAWSDFENHRTVNFVDPNATAKSNYTGNEFSAYAEMGTKAVEFQDLSLHPFLGLAYAYFDRESFSESGAGPSIDLAVTDEVYQSLNLSAGATLDQVFELGPELKLRAEIRARYEYEFLDTNPELKAEFVGSGQGFAVEGVSTGRNVALVGAAIEFIDAGGLSTFLSYDARVNGEFLENTVTLGILVEF
jgi:fibronectin-binding autotransporter adhesin